MRAIEGWSAGTPALRAALTFGCEAVDSSLPGGGLEAGLHEMQPQAHGDWAATLACALALAGRRLAHTVAPSSPSFPGRSAMIAAAPILFCLQGRSTREMGQLHAPGLEAFGLTTERIILVETAREADTLWAMEEGLRSSSLAGVVGMTGPMAPTPARRLALAAREHATPCLALTPPASAGAFCALTRWRIGRAHSKPCPAGSGAPGAARFQIALDRCRQSGRPMTTTSQMFLLDWCHESFCFRLASRLADRAHDESQAGGYAG